MSAKVMLTKRGRFIGHVLSAATSLGIVITIPADWYFPGSTAIYLAAVTTGFTIFYHTEIRYKQSPLFIREDDSWVSDLLRDIDTLKDIDAALENVVKTTSTENTYDSTKSEHNCVDCKYHHKFASSCKVCGMPNIWCDTCSY